MHSKAASRAKLVAPPIIVSADQLAARPTGADTLLPSLELSLEGEGFMSKSLPRNSLSWAAADRPLSREIEPRAEFDRMFRPPSGGVAF